MGSRCSRDYDALKSEHAVALLFSDGSAIGDVVVVVEVWVVSRARLIIGCGLGPNCCSLLAYLQLTGDGTYPTIGCCTELGLLNGDEIPAAMEDCPAGAGAAL